MYAYCVWFSYMYVAGRTAMLPLCKDATGTPAKLNSVKFVGIQAVIILYFFTLVGGKRFRVPIVYYSNLNMNFRDS